MIDDPYVDPATGVLVNLLGLTDAEALASSEAQYVALGLHELDQRPLPGDYDVAHLQAFHRHLFGDVYPWAGDFRTVNIARSASFGDWRHIRTYLDQVFADLARENHLAGLGRAEFVRRLAHYLGEVNAAHPFREGNGRTQRGVLPPARPRGGVELALGERERRGERGGQRDEPDGRQQSTRSPARPRRGATNQHLNRARRGSQTESLAGARDLEGVESLLDCSHLDRVLAVDRREPWQVERRLGDPGLLVKSLPDAECRFVPGRAGDHLGERFGGVERAIRVEDHRHVRAAPPGHGDVGVVADGAGFEDGDAEVDGVALVAVAGDRQPSSTRSAT